MNPQYTRTEIIDEDCKTKYYRYAYDLKCDKCPKTFKYKAGFKAHMDKHNGVKYKCKQCEKAFKTLFIRGEAC